MAAREYRWGHLILLLSILLLFIIGPFFVHQRHGVIVLNIVAAGVLLSAVYALSERKHQFILAIVLAAASIAGTCYLFTFPGHTAVIVGHSILIVMLGYFAGRHSRVRRARRPGQRR
jgi:chromate transport protein ChrA